MPALRTALAGLGLILCAVAMVPVVVTWIESRQARQLRDLLPSSQSTSNGDSRVAVIYFSRSGNTALAARHVARKLDARLYQIEASDYRLGFAGWLRAMWDARGNAATITLRTMNLDEFDTIYLGSPIWLYSPAPPIWEFVSNNRFDGKQVVLFNTLNSDFNPDQIEAFGARLRDRGAKSFEHRFIRRGRMMQQMAPEDMLGLIDAQWFPTVK